MPKDMAEARAANAQREAAKQRDIATQIEAILSNRQVNDELKRKLRYCQDELKRRRGDGLLLEMRTKLLAEAARALSFHP